jgi:hypothetical protein
MAFNPGGINRVSLPAKHECIDPIDTSRQDNEI